MSKSFKEDLAGKRFGRLTVLEFVPNEKANSYWKCKCDCGNIKIIIGKNLINGSTKSCGCYSIEKATERCKDRKKHGLRHTRIYNTWYKMKERCCNKKCKYYKNYGGRGIAVCDEWLHDPKAFYDWAMANGYTDELTIDRIDNNKGYFPENCRWVDVKTQNLNKRNNFLIEYKGEMITLAEIAERTGISRTTIKKRYLNGDRGDKLLRKPRKTK